MLRLVTENWQLKVMSFGFALILWFFVMGERRTEVGYTVPLELHNVPAGMVVINEIPNTIDLRLSGPRALLADLDDKDVGIHIDLAGLKAGITTFRRLDEHLRLPVGIRATRVSPASIEVRLDRLIEKEVPVRARLVGRPGDGLHLEAVEVSPATIRVRGGESELKPLTEVLTERIELSGLKGAQEIATAIDYHGQFSAVNERQPIMVYVRVAGAAPHGKAKVDKGVERR